MTPARANSWTLSLRPRVYVVGLGGGLATVGNPLGGLQIRSQSAGCQPPRRMPSCPTMGELDFDFFGLVGGYVPAGIAAEMGKQGSHAAFGFGGNAIVEFCFPALLVDRVKEVDLNGS